MGGKIIVEIVEKIEGYYQVIINDLPIANYKWRNEAEKLVNHFVEINADKNIVVK